MNQYSSLLVILSFPASNYGSVSDQISRSIDHSNEQLSDNDACFQNPDNLITVLENVKEEIAKIKAEYAQIEKDKTKYDVYQNIPSRGLLLAPVSVVEEMGFVYGNHSFIKEHMPVYSEQFRRLFGGYKTTFYFDDDFDLRLVILNEYDHWDGFWNNIFYFYYAKNAKHPFFFFMEGYTQEYDSDYQETTYYQDRIYYKMDTTFNAGDCPQIIRALNKKIVNPETETQINKIPNQPMEAGTLHGLAKKILDDRFGVNLKNMNFIYKSDYW